MIHGLLKKLTPVLQSLLRWYLRKPRPYRYKALKVIVDPGVFYPKFVFSTKLLLEFLDEKDLLFSSHIMEKAVLPHNLKELENDLIGNYFEHYRKAPKFQFGNYR